MPLTVLVIDDEPDLIRMVEYNLEKEGWLVLSARDGDAGLRIARDHAPDAVLLDVMLPGMDGWEVCRRLRGDPRTAPVPIVMLTAKSQEADRVLGLELGADDYITKPFGVRELIARLRAVRRRFEAAASPAEVLRVGSMTLDSGRREVAVAGKPVPLTTTEFDLLRVLVGRPGRVFSRDDLISAVRRDEAVILDRTVDVHVASIRRKMGRHADRIETVRGVGYRFKDR
ncbi:MAG: response regulator transcription factor [Planctomycetes bacterium]|nr:response regulator transcription factor [Planctomycetota bacterium]